MAFHRNNFKRHREQRREHLQHRPCYGDCCLCTLQNTALLGLMETIWWVHCSSEVRAWLFSSLLFRASTKRPLFFFSFSCHSFGLLKTCRTWPGSGQPQHSTSGREQCSQHTPGAALERSGCEGDVVCCTQQPQNWLQQGWDLLGWPHTKRKRNSHILPYNKDRMSPHCSREMFVQRKLNF